MIQDLFTNQILIASMLAWFLAQTVKVPIEFLYTRKWNWSLWFSAGGMPSSHSAIVSACALGIGLNNGFDTPLFGMSIVLAMVVIYDATGVRRQAGLQAHKINYLIEELLQGHPISEETLKELLGHTPLQAFVGIIFGIIIELIIWAIW